MSLFNSLQKVDLSPTLTSTSFSAPTHPLERLLDSLTPNGAVLLVRAATEYAAEWLGGDRLERVLGQSLAGPVQVEIWSLTPLAWAVALRFPGQGSSAMQSLEVHALRQSLSARLTREWREEVSQEIAVSITPVSPLSHLDTLQENISELNALLEMLVNHQLTPQFQPIVNLRDGRVFGYETLIRGPKGGVLRRPGQMFRVADKARVVAWFDMACLEECFANAASQGIHHLLFVNMDAEGLAAVSLQERPIELRAREHGIAPPNIVIEITERQTVGDFPRLIEDIGRLRQQGFQIAIDDAGAGYSSLRAVAELKPDFVKIDRDLIKNIDVCGERRALLAALSEYARNVGTVVIAEGAETRGELTALIDLGIPYGQGYVMAKPADMLRGIPRDTREFIQERVRVREFQRSGNQMTAGMLARRGFALDPQTPLSEAVRKLTKDPGLTSIAVVEEERVCGLLLRQQVASLLSMAKTAQAEMVPPQTVSEWMRTGILQVEDRAPIREVAHQIVSRQEITLDADIVVLDSAGAFQGILAVRDVLDAAAQEPVHRARYADPLTGLPGRVPLERELRERIAADASLGVVRVDLCHLALINDQCGLASGDRLIQSLGDLLQRVSRDRGCAEDLTAHLGGDNFILVTDGQHTQEICRTLLEGFPAIAPVTASDGDRNSSRTNGAACTMAIAAVTNRNRRFQNLDQVITGLHDLMRQVRSQPGSRYAIDGVAGRN